MANTAPVEADRAAAAPAAGWHPPTAPRVSEGPVWLVLHDAHDPDGPALAQALERGWQRTARGTPGSARRPQVLALSPLALRMRSRWALRVESGGTRCRLQLADGQVLDDTALAGVVNRLGPAHPGGTDAEAAYQASEWSALWLAWLHGLRCRVINRPRPVDPHPQLHDGVWWRQLALLAGLRVWPDTALGAADGSTGGCPASALIVGQEVMYSAPVNAAGALEDVALRRALRRMAELSGSDLLAVHGVLDGQGLWHFRHAEPHPALHAFGEAGVNLLVRALQAGSVGLPGSAALPPAWPRPAATARRAGLVAVLGRETEGPCHLLLQALKRQGTPAVMLDQRRLGPPDAAWFNRLRDEGGRPVRLDRLHGLYLRPADTRALGLGAADAAKAAEHTQAWSACAEWAPVTVVNRLSAMVSNSSKPLQSQVLASLGFAIPPMLLTTRPEAVSAFEAEHGPLVFKSASGVRSIVRPLDAVAWARLEHVRHAPTLFQKRLRGTNLRVHVVGEAVFATEIDSGAIDYRYAGRQGPAAELRATRLPIELEGCCRRAAEHLGLRFAGLDLMLADDGQVYCFEVNPSPGYSWYEDATGQDISGALAALLSGATAETARRRCYPIECNPTRLPSVSMK